MTYQKTETIELAPVVPQGQEVKIYEGTLKGTVIAGKHPIIKDGRYTGTGSTPQELEDEGWQAI